MANKLKVAIVGCGAVAEKRHIPGFARLKQNVTIQAVCDKNKELASKVAAQYGITNVYTTQTEMLAKENLDIIDVCTPPQIHAPIAIEALEHGCHVLMEKPMALSAADCDSMIEAAKKVSDYFIDNLSKDYVPCWDFEAPGAPDAKRDSSAAAIAASGLFELSTLVETKNERY